MMLWRTPLGRTPSFLISIACKKARAAARHVFVQVLNSQDRVERAFGHADLSLRGFCSCLAERGPISMDAVGIWSPGPDWLAD